MILAQHRLTWTLFVTEKHVSRVIKLNIYFALVNTAYLTPKNMVHQTKVEDLRGRDRVETKM